jgi:hypothetical protein
VQINFDYLKVRGARRINLMDNKCRFIFFNNAFVRILFTFSNVSVIIISVSYLVLKEAYEVASLRT